MRRSSAGQTARTRSALGVAALCLAVLPSCTAAEPRPVDTPPASASSAASGQARVPEREFIGPGSPLVQELWRPVRSLPQIDTVLPEHLDFAEIRQAPSLHDAPIPRAVMAAGTEPQWYGVGEVAVMSPAGSWRIIDRSALGMRDPHIVEQQFELSPDGRTLALGDAHGIVFVDLATAETVRVPNDAGDVVLHWWSPDSSRIVFTPRSSPERAWEVNVRDRTSTRVAFHAWSSSMGRNGRVSEFVPTTSRMGRPRRKARPFTGVRVWQDGAVVREEPLRVGLPINVRVAKHGSSLVAVTQWSGDREQVARGVLALEPSSGRSVGLLRLRQHQTVWATVLGPLGERWILLEISSGPGGGIVAWDPVQARLRAVTAIDEQAALVSIAGSALSP